MRNLGIALLPLLLALLFARPAHAQLTVLSVNPSSNASNIGPLAPIIVELDRAVNTSTLPPSLPPLPLPRRNLSRSSRSVLKSS